MEIATTIYSERPDLDTMGGRLCRARDAIGLSTAQLARRLGVQTATIQAWENDRAQPRANRLAMLAGMLGVSPAWLLHGVGTAPSDETDEDFAQSLTIRLDRLKQLHDETAALIDQLERDVRRHSATA